VPNLEKIGKGFHRMSTINTILEDVKENDQSSIAMSNMNVGGQMKQVRLNKGTNSTRDIHV